MQGEGELNKDVLVGGGVHDTGLQGCELDL